VAQKSCKSSSTMGGPASIPHTVHPEISAISLASAQSLQIVWRHGNSMGGADPEKGSPHATHMMPTASSGREAFVSGTLVLGDRGRLHACKLGSKYKYIQTHMHKN